MRLFAVSDLHVDYEPNVAWIDSLSRSDYQQDVLIVAGDLSHRPNLLLPALNALLERFSAVLFVPGNHDIWVSSNDPQDSLEQHSRLCEQVRHLGVHVDPLRLPHMTIVPLFTWYDFSFGEPGRRLKLAWMDFHRCRWPEEWSAPEIARHFLALNPAPEAVAGRAGDQALVTFSHFMPRADLLPAPAVEHFGFLLPVLGGWALDTQLRSYNVHNLPHCHIYGHSHVNVDKVIDGVRYVNNARGYPNEPRYASRALREIDLARSAQGGT